MGLARVFKPIALNYLKRCNKGELVVGLGPKVVGAMGGGDLIWPKPPLPFSRALDEFFLSKAREESGDEDPLVGLTRAALSLKALKVVERASLIDETLFAEASKYVETLSFSMGGRELSFSTSSSRFGQVVMNEGSFGGLTFMDVERSRTR